jgi:GNAT superfamily N-acetyltransferase
MHCAISEITIRQASEHDAPEFARLLTLLGHPTDEEAVLSRWRAWAEAGNIALVVPLGDGLLAGLMSLHRMVVLHRPKPIGRLTSLVVDTPLRGQGVGRALVVAAEELLTRQGCGMLELTSHKRRAEAHAFYERLGYEQTSLRFAKTLTPIG